jgi:uncharacterized membrane protein
MATMIRAMFSKLRQYFVSGFILMLPIFLTFWVLSILFRISDGFLGGFINAFLYDNYGYRIPGLGIFIMVLLVLAVGALASNVFARRIFPNMEHWLLRFPIVRSIYPPAKQLTQFMFSEKKDQQFSRTALVRWPHKDCFTLGFITRTGLENSGFKKGGKYHTVFIPTVPNPITGFITIFEEQDIVFLDLGVDEALKMIFSGGVVSPNVFKTKSPDSYTT